MHEYVGHSVRTCSIVRGSLNAALISNAVSAIITHHAGKAECTITINDGDLMDMVSGKLTGQKVP